MPKISTTSSEQWPKWKLAVAGWLEGKCVDYGTQEQPAKSPPGSSRLPSSATLAAWVREGESLGIRLWPRGSSGSGTRDFIDAPEATLKRLRRIIGGSERERAGKPKTTRKGSSTSSNRTKGSES